MHTTCRLAQHAPLAIADIRRPCRRPRLEKQMFLNAFQECISAPLQISVHLPVAHVPDQHLQGSAEGRGLSKGAGRSKRRPRRHLRGRPFGRRCVAARGCAANNLLVGQLESECICKDTLEGCFVLLRGLCELSAAAPSGSTTTTVTAWGSGWQCDGVCPSRSAFDSF